MSTLKLEIITPDKNIFSGDIKAVTVPGAAGSFQVLVNHAATISTLAPGKIKIILPGGEEKLFKTGSGTVEVLNNKVIVLVERAA